LKGQGLKKGEGCRSLGKEKKIRLYSLGDMGVSKFRSGCFRPLLNSLQEGGGNRVAKQGLGSWDGSREPHIFNMLPRAG
jgi:hypothetical protein